jgi:hypothetical protein
MDSLQKMIHNHQNGIKPVGEQKFDHKFDPNAAPWPVGDLKGVHQCWRFLVGMFCALAGETGLSVFQDVRPDSRPRHFLTYSLHGLEGPHMTT